MQTKNTLPMAIQPSPRTWVFSTDLRARLPLVVLFWSTCWLLTGCGKRSYQQFIRGQDPAIPNHSAIQAPMVNPYDLSEQSSDETFEQFFRTRWAGEIWMLLLHYVSPDNFGNLIDEKTICQVPSMKRLLAQHTTRIQDQLKVGIETYVQRLNQEAAYKKFLERNGLDAVWESLDQARGQATLDLSRQLQSCATPLKIEVLEGIVRFILNHCPNLVELDLSYNGLTMLPETFGNLTQLVNLNLSANQLAVLPASFRNLTKLRWFTGYDLNETAFQDLTAILFRDFLEHAGLYEVWQWLDQARGQATLYLYAMLRNCTPLVQSQVLERMVPFILNHCPNVVEVNLCSNKLTELPDTFGRLIQLRKVNLSYNQLEVLPDSFGNLINLNELYLHENQLTQLPDSFGSLRDLQKLDLFDNKLTVLPDSFGNLTQLQRLKLTCNQLITLPKSFGNLINLNELSLAYNQLTTLPDCFGNLINLNDLNLYKNQLQVLPGCLQKLTKLRLFTVKKNPFLQPNATLQDTHILVTRANLKLKLFPRQEYVRQHSLNSTFNYDVNREIFELTQPGKRTTYILTYQYYPVLVFIKKLGQATLSQPVPICLDLSGKQIVDHVYSQIQVIIIDK